MAVSPAGGYILGEGRRWQPRSHTGPILAIESLAQNTSKMHAISERLGMVLLGPILALATFLVIGPFDLDASAPALRLILLADLVYVLVVVALVLGQVVAA